MTDVPLNEYRWLDRDHAQQKWLVHLEGDLWMSEWRDLT